MVQNKAPPDPAAYHPPQKKKMLQEVVTRHSRTACGMKECMDQSLSIDDYCKKYYLKITLRKTKSHFFHSRSIR